MTKKIISVVLESDVKYQLTGTLRKAQQAIQELIDQYGPDARLDIDKEYESYSDYQSVYARVFGNREESDAEYEKRTAEEAHYAAKRMAHEQAEFERLSKLFGKQNGQNQ